LFTGCSRSAEFSLRGTELRQPWTKADKLFRTGDQHPRKADEFPWEVASLGPIANEHTAETSQLFMEVKLHPAESSQLCVKVNLHWPEASELFAKVDLH
jgi:hypothetical protein